MTLEFSTCGGNFGSVANVWIEDIDDFSRDIHVTKNRSDAMVVKSFVPSYCPIL